MLVPLSFVSSSLFLSCILVSSPCLSPQPCPHVCLVSPCPVCQVGVSQSWSQFSHFLFYFDSPMCYVWYVKFCFPCFFSLSLFRFAPRSTHFALIPLVYILWVSLCSLLCLPLCCVSLFYLQLICSCPVL